MIKYFDSFIFAINPQLEFGQVNPCQQRFSDILPDNRIDDLKHLLAQFQRHTSCGNHCLRRDRKTHKIACRFNFPCEILHKSEINNSGGYLRFYPKRNDPYVQRYSKEILHGWRANHDFSAICSPLAVLYYIAKYIAKNETLSKFLQTFIKEFNKTSNGDIDIKSFMSRLFIKSLGERDISAQEICHVLMGWPLVHSSRVFITLSLFNQNWESLNIVHRKVKVNKSSIMDKYRARPSSVMMKQMSLLYFVQNFDAKNNRYFQHKKPRVVRIIPLIKLHKNANDTELFYRQECILHIPFRCDPFDLLKNYRNKAVYSWEQLYRLKNLDQHEDNVYNDAVPDDGEELPVADNFMRQNLVELNCGITTLVNADTIGNRLLDICHNWDEARLIYPSLTKVMLFLYQYKFETLNIPEPESTSFQLSTEQQKIMNLVSKQINCIQLKKTKVADLPLQTICQGKAGSGKSTLINEMVIKITKELGQGSVSVCAPTGSAAINIGGNTLHSEFKLSLNPESISPLEGSRQKAFQIQTKNLKFLIIDEMSMIGAKHLWQLNCRLSEINPESDEDFGGLYVYFFGDFRQLPPVMDTPLYYQFCKNFNGNKGLRLFQSITNRIELTCTYRHINDKHFAALVDRIGLGIVTKMDYDLLATRNIHFLSIEEVETFNHALYLCSTNDKVDEANDKHLENLGTPIAEIISKNTPNVKLRKNEEETGGLHHIIHLSVGCRVMLTRNLWIKAGLVNGALGTVSAIVYDINVKPPSSPLYVLVKFDKYYGSTFTHDSIPIIPEVSKWSRDNIEFHMTQIPLILAYSSSIHKGQGLTIPKCIIDIGNREFCSGLTYVALTRARNLSDIMFKPFFSLTRFSCIGKQMSLQSRVEFINSFSH